MRFLTLSEVLGLHNWVIAQSGGAYGIRDLNVLASAVAQPHMTFGGQDLYPTVAEKAAALGFSLIKNHGFVDGNKRIGHAAMEVFLVLNGHEIAATVDDQEQAVLQVAAITWGRDEFTAWVVANISPLSGLLP